MQIEVRPRKIKTGRSNQLETLRSEKSNTPKLENEDPLRFLLLRIRKKTFKSYARSPHRSPEEACQPKVDFFPSWAIVLSKFLNKLAFNL